MTIRVYSNYHAEEILPLYTAVGWTAYTDDPEALEQGYHRSLLSLAAYDGDKLVGVIRVVGDGTTIVLIQDILVYPKYQHKGVGTALIRKVLEEFSSVRQIQLATDNTEKTKLFYRSVGFLPYDELGCCGFMYCQ